MITLTREEAEQIFNLFERLDNVFCITAKWHGNPQKGYVTTKIRDYSSVIIDLGNQVERNQVLRARLSEPEQAPVAFIDVTHRTLEWAKPTRWETPTVAVMDKVPLYTAPLQREWVGLTDETYWEMWVESPSDVLRFAHAIEAKIKEKNYDKR